MHVHLHFLTQGLFESICTSWLKGFSSPFALLDSRVFQVHLHFLTQGFASSFALLDSRALQVHLHFLTQGLCKSNCTSWLKGFASPFALLDSRALQVHLHFLTQSRQSITCDGDDKATHLIHCESTCSSQVRLGICKSISTDDRDAVAGSVAAAADFFLPWASLKWMHWVSLKMTPACYVRMHQPDLSFPYSFRSFGGMFSGKRWPSSVAKAFARSALTDFLCPARAHCKAAVSGSWSCLFWWCVQSIEARLWKLWLWSCSSLTFLELSAWWTDLRLCMWNHPSCFKCLM